MPQWLSTNRLAQISGGYDPEGLTHFGNSTEVGIDGIDLGASVHHAGRTFVYFGDVIPDPGRQADAVGVIDDIRIPERSAIVVSRQHTNLSSAFFIDGDGALCVAWVKDSGIWRHPLRIGPQGLAPAGGHLAAAYQLPGQLDVFFIGNDGGLYVAWVFGDGEWHAPLLISQPDVGEPGGSLMATKQFDNQLDVFFIGRDRRLNVAWVVDGGVWEPALAIGHPDRPYPRPGAGITACRQGENQLDVFFIGEDGCLYVAWSSPDIQNSVWQGPQNVSPEGMPTSVPGAHLVAFKQMPNQVTVTYVGLGGNLTSMWVVEGSNAPGPDIWQGPAPAVPGNYHIEPGSFVTAARQSLDQWDVFLIGEHGTVDVYWVSGGQPWQGPYSITHSDSSLSGSGIAAVLQLETQLTILFPARHGDLSVCWVDAADPVWRGPVVINPSMFGLRFVTKDGQFAPFTIRGDQTDPTRLWILPQDQTPTGAFSHGGRVYVFAVWGSQGGAVSCLTSSSIPDSPEPYKFEWNFSRYSDAGSGSFLQVAPVLVRSVDIPGHQGRTDMGVILFGHGKARNVPLPFGVHLAFMPLDPNGDLSPSTIKFYKGLNEFGSPEWTSAESQSKTLLNTQFGWTSLSVAFIPVANKWIILRQLAVRDPAESHRHGIVARIADQPWEIETTPDIELFDPEREQAWDRYMFRPNVPSPDPFPMDHPAFAYGAYILHKYLHFDESTGQLTLHYLMSTGRPYQVQLMRSVLKL